MSIEQPDLRALKREWTIGLAVVIGGFALAIGVAAFLTFGQKHAAVIPDQTQIAEQTPPHDRDIGRSGRIQFCRTALANAKALGLLPEKGHLSDPNPRPTDQPGRYICDASTDKTEVSLAADIVCDEVAKARCVSLQSVTGIDGSVLYERAR